MVNFIVKGPFDVPLKEAANGARFIDVDKLHSLKADSNGSINKAGCYVFSWRAARGSLPIYVGKATGKILSEAFNARNLNNLAEFINNKRRGRLQIYIVFQDRIRLIANKTAIAELEEFLIGRAAIRNPNLINIHGNRPASWTIVGVANHGAGRPGATVQDFRKMLGIVRKTKPSSRPTALPTVIQPEVIEPSETESVPGPTESDLDEASKGSDGQSLSN